jgi:hypothetical protein
MGFIQQSNTKKIYAYLTQYARQQILDGNEADFTVKYFSLHDNDVNYKISANLVNNSYNTLPSGFVPDITGDNDGCLLSIANGIQLENSLGGFVEPPQPVSLFGTVVGTCEIGGSPFEPVRTGRFQINVTNIQGGTGDYSWYVKTEVISFSSATTSIEDATILSTTTSPNYTVGTPQYFNATFNFADTYLPREADSYNFTVYARDSSGTEVEIGKFTDTNCSKRTFGVVPNFGIEPLDLHPSYPQLNLITESILGNTYISNNKRSFALFVVDNGNRRRDLNLTDADRLAYDGDGDRMTIATTNSDTNKALANSYRLPFNEEDALNDSDAYYSESVLREGAIANPLFAINLWKEQSHYLIPDAQRNGIFQIITNTNGFNYDILHPTVKPFNDMVDKGFDISYVELALKSDPQVYTIGTSEFTLEYDGDGYTFPMPLNGIPDEIGALINTEIFFSW